MPSAGLRRGERGFTLVELLITMLILVVGLMGAVAMIDGANARTAVNAQREAGNGLVREVIEDGRSVPYAKLTPSGVVAQLQSVSGLQDVDPVTLAWTVKRRNVTYTLNATVCSVDDGKDDYGSHTGANFCPSSATTGTADRNPDDYKRLTIKASWTRASGGTRDVQQTALVSNEANTGGPALSFVSQSPGGLGTTEITDDSVFTVDFGVQTAAPAAAVKYLVDGVVKSTDSPTGTSSSFTWRIHNGPDGHLPDGTYVISATAYDDLGRAGPSSSRTLRLNRDEPLAPTGFKGGWNALRNVVDLEWNRNNEPDVMGYRVYRSSASGNALVCELVNQPNVTDCVDSNPPNDPSFVYAVVALDENPFTGSPREGAKSPNLTATRSNNQPNQPLTLTATVVNPDLQLDWTQPLAASPSYPGDTVIFYRIYRGGTAIADRYAVRSPGTATSFKDGNAGSQGHKYWITAVDQNYSESNPLGPVSIP
jgi:prepilin-type N-terminal cleavage/methylation domain-containing protein